MATLGALIPLPKKYLKDPVRIKEYEALEKDPATLLAKFKWWSLHDLMTEYHDGLMPKENNANFLKFSIDLSADELKRAKITDPNRLNQIQTLMTPGLKAIETATDQMIMQKQIDATQQLQSSTMNALARAPGQPLTPPVKKGQKLGELVIRIDELDPIVMPLVAEKDVSAPGLWITLKGLFPGNSPAA